MDGTQHKEDVTSHGTQHKEDVTSQVTNMREKELILGELTLFGQLVVHCCSHAYYVWKTDKFQRKEFDDDTE
jgi:hypothetical protein